MNAIGRTDIGTVRANNEDSIFIASEGLATVPNLFIVADGIGGHKAGEVASTKAVECFKNYALSHKYSTENCLDFMVDAMLFVNSEVYKMSLQTEDYSGMGTTFSACIIDQGKVYISHVGDSRIYIFGGGKMAQLTTDHTYVNELVKAGQFSPEAVRFHPQKNIITRAVGIDSVIAADALVFNVYPGDTLLLCSDGLSDTVSEDEMFSVISNNNENLSDKVDELIDLAKLNGATDNISVVLVNI